MTISANPSRMAWTTWRMAIEMLEEEGLQQQVYQQSADNEAQETENSPRCKRSMSREKWLSNDLAHF